MSKGYGIKIKHILFNKNLGTETISNKEHLENLGKQENISQCELDNCVEHIQQIFIKGRNIQIKENTGK